MTQMEAPASAQVNANIWTAASPLKAEFGMMPFLIVSAVRAPTVMAPSISNMVPKTMACRYEMEREETLVAQALATSSADISKKQVLTEGNKSHRNDVLAPLLKASSMAKKVPITKT